jgi:hypothetical protein
MNKSDQKKRHRRSSNSDSDDDQSYSKSKKIIFLLIFLLFQIFIEIHADGYDDQYRGNADDRAWLKTLTERQREEELLKRHEQREILKHR